MEGVSPEVGREALRLAAHKLSIATQVKERQGAHGAR
jgi:ribosomal protein L16/L10AE